MKLAEFFHNKKTTFLFIVCLMLISLVMFAFVEYKEGFHEDEIHSYGSANYKYDDVFYASGDRDATNRVIAEHIISDTYEATADKYNYYKDHPEEFNALVEAETKAEKPVWKTPQEAKEYLVVSEGEQFNFISPYYNQINSNNPPLFYMLVHLVSSLFTGVFSKYIIFGINLVFILATCLLIRGILKAFNKDHLSIPAVLLYGLSAGGISTVLFFRMYAMLTFFVVLYMYLNIKIAKSNFFINKITAFLLIVTAVFGFLTQYSIYLFIIPVFIIMVLRMIKLKKLKDAVFYAIYHIVGLILGFLLYIPSLDHIFSNNNSGQFFDKFEAMINRLLYSFSLNRFVGVALFLIIISFIFVKLISKTDDPQKKSASVFNIFLFVVPIICFIAGTALRVSYNPYDISKLVNYIAPVLPIVALCFIVFAEKAIDLLGLNNKNTIVVYAIVAIISVAGFVANSPSYLYRGYSKYMQIAENHKDLNYVYVYDNYYTHLNSLPEMTVYNKTLMINFYDEKQINVLAEDEELKNSDKFVLSIKKWMIKEENPDEVLNKVLDLTGYRKFEPLHHGNDDTQSVIYLVSK